LNGALEFLWTQPFREMTVAELMSITGVSRSAFYQYFSARPPKAVLQTVGIDILRPCLFACSVAKAKT
jgi:hypothetical protein